MKEISRIYKIARTNGATATRALYIARVWQNYGPTADDIFWYMFN